MATSQDLTATTQPAPQPVLPTSHSLHFFDFLPLGGVLLFALLLYWLSERLFPKHWPILVRSARTRVWLMILLPAQFLLIVPTIDRNLWNDFLSGATTKEDIWDLSAGLSSFGLFVWSQIIIFFADRKGNDRKAIEAEVVAGLERVVTYTKGVTKAFLGVVGQKAQRIASYLKKVEEGKVDGELAVKTLTQLWDPKTQKHALLGAIWRLIQSDVGLPFWVKVTYFERKGDYLVPLVLHDGEPQPIETPPLDERECYNISCSPSRSLPGFCGKDAKTKAIPDIATASQSGLSPIIGCPLRKYNAQSAGAFPLRVGDTVRGVITIHTDKPNFFTDDESTHSELELLADNVTERLYYEVNVDKLLALLEKGSGSNAKRKKNSARPGRIEERDTDTSDDHGRDGASAA